MDLVTIVDRLKDLKADIKNEGIEYSRIIKEAKKAGGWSEELTRQADAVRKRARTVCATSIEKSLESGLDQLIARLPKAWWREQLDFRARLGDQHLIQPLVLYGSVVDDPIPNGIHRYAYALMLCKETLAKKDSYDVYRGAELVPLVAALCNCLNALSSVKGGDSKLEDLPTAPNEQIDSKFMR